MASQNKNTQPTTSASQTESVIWTSAQSIMSTGVIPQLQPVTTTVGGQTATTTTSTVTYTSTRPTHTGAIPKSPVDDPRVGWIHALSKDTLVAEMAKYGLGTDGNVSDLRKRFCKFWTDPNNAKRIETGIKPHVDNQLSVLTSHSGEVSTHAGATIPDYGNMATNWVLNTRYEPGFHVNPYESELVNTREMLGLSPNADSLTVQRALADMVKSSRALTLNATQEQSLYRSVIERPKPLDSVVDDPKTAYDSVPRTYAAVVTNVERPNTISFEQTSSTQYRDVNREVRDPHIFSERNSNRDFASLCDTVRKWNLKYDGKKDPVSFLERLEELIEAYSLFPNDILKTLPEFFHGSALLWYRNMKDSWHTFHQFKLAFDAQFLPPGYRHNLDNEVRKRTQGENEPVRDFVVAITTLIRRSGIYSEHQKLELVYNNMRPEYKIMVRRQDFCTLHGLIERAEEYEAYERERRSFRPPPPPSQALVAETAYPNRRKVDKTFDAAAMVETKTTAADNRDPQQTSSWVVPNWKVKQSNKGYGVKQSNRQATTTLNSGNTMRRAQNNNRHENQKSVITENDTKRVVCWNCDKLGHSFKQCKRPKVLRCFHCKTEGIATIHCDCSSGNFRRAQNGGQLSPKRETKQTRPPTSGLSGSTQ